jgi:hypothetical protein
VIDAEAVPINVSDYWVLFRCQKNKFFEISITYQLECSQNQINVSLHSIASAIINVSCN